MSALGGDRVRIPRPDKDRDSWEGPGCGGIRGDLRGAQRDPRRGQPLLGLHHSKGFAPVPRRGSGDCSGGGKGSAEGRGSPERLAGLGRAVYCSSSLSPSQGSHALPLPFPVLAVGNPGDAERCRAPPQGHCSPRCPRSGFIPLVPAPGAVRGTGGGLCPPWAVPTLPTSSQPHPSLPHPSQRLQGGSSFPRSLGVCLRPHDKITIPFPFHPSLWKVFMEVFLSPDHSWPCMDGPEPIPATGAGFSCRTLLKIQKKEGKCPFALHKHPQGAAAAPAGRTRARRGEPAPVVGEQSLFTNPVPRKSASESR